MLPPTPHNFILFQLDFDVKFPLLRLLLFLIDLKSTIVRLQREGKIDHQSSLLDVEGPFCKKLLKDFI